MTLVTLDPESFQKFVSSPETTLEQLQLCVVKPKVIIYPAAILTCYVSVGQKRTNFVLTECMRRNIAGPANVHIASANGGGPGAFWTCIVEVGERASTLAPQQTFEPSILEWAAITIWLRRQATHLRVHPVSEREGAMNLVR